jgi:MFS family permease
MNSNNNVNKGNDNIDTVKNEIVADLTSNPPCFAANQSDEEEVVSEEKSKSFSQRNYANTSRGISQVNMQSNDDSHDSDLHINHDSEFPNLPQHAKVNSESKNINRILLYSFFAFSSRSLWNQSVLSAFVYLLKSDNPEFVGILTGIMGVCQLVTSFPAGFLADKYRRDTILKIGSVFGIIASLLTIAASKAKDFVFLSVALAFWGLFWGVTNPSVSALFAGSMTDGERSKYFTQRMITQYLGSATGPLVAFFMFSFLGNDWTIEECQIVLCVAQILAFPALIVLCTLSDDYMVTSNSSLYYDDSDTDNSSDDEESDDNSSCDEGSDCEYNDHIVSGRSHVSSDLETPLLSESNDSKRKSKNSSKSQCCNVKLPKSRLIALCVASADMLGGLAAGMSIRYFPIFFLENLKMSPRMVQLMFLCSTSSMAISGKITQKLGSRFGRLETATFIKCLGATMFMAMVLCYQINAPIWVVCTLWVVRTTLSNSVGALTKSVLMDSVPSHERAKWSALESVNTFGWAGSAVLGGFLVSWQGIEFNFYLTASLQILATIPFMVVLKKVGRLQE